MAVPAERSEISGALVVAAGLILGGLLTYFCDRLSVPTPGLLLRRPSAVSVEAALTRACEDGGVSGDVSGEGSGSHQESADIGEKSGGQLGEPNAAGRGADYDGSPSRLRTGRLGPIEINSAGVDELQQLDGIGPALAGRIVAYRKTNGPFRRMEDLLEVRGIGPATLARIKRAARLSGSPDGAQNTLRTSTSSQADSSAFQR